MRYIFYKIDLGTLKYHMLTIILTVIDVCQPWYTVIFRRSGNFG